MSPRADGPPRSDCGADVGAYVLGALEHEEARAFRAHMDSCVVCREEAAALRAAVEALPLSAPQLKAPRTLRRRVFSELRPQQGRARHPARERVAARVRLRPAAALAGALAVAAAAIGVVVGSSGSSTRVIRASVLARDASAVVSLSHGSAQLIIHGMPPPPPGKVYEVWLKRGANAPAATDALFSVTAHGDAAVVVPGDLHAVNEVLVTPERIGGSRVPTHAPVILARLS
jgi:anti-sigma-K factor RskA